MSTFYMVKLLNFIYEPYAYKFCKITAVLCSVTQRKAYALYATRIKKNERMFLLYRTYIDLASLIRVAVMEKLSFPAQ